MNCPTCDQPAKVTQTRTTLQGIKRRRHCDHCGERWNTMEVPLPGRSSTREYRADRRGCFVPGKLESEWLFLKSKRLNNAEAASALKIKYFGGTNGTD